MSGRNRSWHGSREIKTRLAYGAGLCVLTDLRETTAACMEIMPGPPGPQGLRRGGLGRWRRPNGKEEVFAWAVELLRHRRRTWNATRMAVKPRWKSPAAWKNQGRSATRHNDDRVHVLTALRFGVRGYVLKSQAVYDPIQAIKQVFRGEVYLSLGVSRAVDAFLSKSEFSKSGSQCANARVVKLIGEGKTTKEAAGSWASGAKTAESHRTRLMQKLSIHSTAEPVPARCDTGSSRPGHPPTVPRQRPRDVEVLQRIRPSLVWRFCRSMAAMCAPGTDRAKARKGR